MPGTARDRLRPRRHLLEDIKHVAVFEYDLPALGQSLDTPLVKLVVDQVQARVGRPQPGEAQVSRERVVVIVILHQRLQQDLGRERIGQTQSGQRNGEIATLYREVVVVVIDREAAAEFVTDAIIDMRRENDPVTTELAAYGGAKTKRQGLGFVGGEDQVPLSVTLDPRLDPDLVDDLEGIVDAGGE